MNKDECYKHMTARGLRLGSPGCKRTTGGEYYRFTHRARGIANGGNHEFIAVPLKSYLNKVNASTY
jgi:hypothetical protein